MAYTAGKTHDLNWNEPLGQETAEGISLSRARLDNWTHSAILPLKPLAQAVMDGVLDGDHIKIDETPVKAGKGKNR